MTMFMTKVWGFDEPVGPLQFASEGWRDNALAKLHDGDRVLLVGTQGVETGPDERGRALGLVEPTRERVLSLDFDLPRADGDFNDADDYKWPVGLHNRRAWRLIDRPLLTEISSRAFSMDSAQGIVPLEPAEAATIDALARREVVLLAPRAHAGLRLDRGGGGSGGGGRTRQGPPPSDVLRRSTMHMRRAPASTYAMELVGARRPSIKVGWAFDATRRRDLFNRASMPAVGGLRYKLLVTHRWNSARLAYAFEQSLLRHCAASISPDNREVIVGMAPATFESVWRRSIGRSLRNG